MALTWRSHQHPTHRTVVTKAKYFEITRKIGHIQFCSDPLQRRIMIGKALIVGMKIPQGTAISQTLSDLHSTISSLAEKPSKKCNPPN